MQNMPRGGTFPVKKVFVSRWEGGKILEADFAQLEFRTAAFLSQDDTAMQEVRDGFDVHAYTASVITDAGQKTSRLPYMELLDMVGLRQRQSITHTLLPSTKALRIGTRR